MNLIQIEKLAGNGCTVEEIESVEGCCRDILYRRFSDILKKGHDHAKESLRRMHWKSAAMGNATMQIWLGKNLLGQTNKHEIETTNQQVFEIVYYGHGKPQTWADKSSQIP